MKKNEKIIFRGYTKKEEDYWVAICIDLDIVAQGATKVEATKACYELMIEYLRYVTTHHRKHLDRYLHRPAAPEFLNEYNAILGRKLSEYVQTTPRRTATKTPVAPLIPNMVHNFMVNTNQFASYSA